VIFTANKLSLYTNFRNIAYFISGRNTFQESRILGAVSHVLAHGVRFVLTVQGG
jgi:hypothetical protein